MRARGVPPGHPLGPPKPRKPRGPNKIPASVKDMVLASLSEVGGLDYLKRQAEENPQAYMALLGKIIPLQVTGPNDGPMQITVIDYAKADPLQLTGPKGE